MINSQGKNKMKSKKIGIVTLFWENYNYGGFLQSLALNYYLRNNGYQVEDICFPKKQKKFKNKYLILKRKKGTMFSMLFSLFYFIRYLSQIINSLFKSIIYLRAGITIRSRKKQYKNCFNMVPHSKKIYHENDISSSNSIYDTFIVGSDQVWKANSSGLSNIYWLKFVHSDKKKISYAASFGTSHFCEDNSDFVASTLNSMQAISCREKTGKEIVEYHSTKKAMLVCDPVFLLSKKDWKTYIKKVQSEKFVFLYLLGDNNVQRKVAVEFAKKNKLSLIEIPYISSYRKKETYSYEWSSANPFDFLSLIESADYVITDSFHAVAFSIIFQKRFAAFERFKGNSNISMNTRIWNILKLCCLEENLVSFGNEKDILKENYIKSSKVFSESSEFLKFVEESKWFLDSNLEE